MFFLYLKTFSFLLVQLYLPPEWMLNKDFLKEIFTDQKSLLRLDQVKRISVPQFDELSVIKLWPMLQSDEKFMRYFPKKLAKGRVPDREYFFNLVNTFQPNYLQQIIKHANSQRNSVEAEVMEKEVIEISDDWWNALNASPFVSCKFLMLGILTTWNFFLLSRTQRQNHSLVEGKFETSATGSQEAQDKSSGHVR